jgi:CRP-like cAMP-binding protein
MADPDPAPKPAPAVGSAAARTRLLGAIGVFAGCPEAMLRGLGEEAVSCTLAAEEVLFRSGDSSDEMYVVVAGRLEVAVNRSGRRIRLAELGPGDYCGEMALLTGQPRSATVSAAEGSTVLRLSRAPMARWLHRHPDTMALLCRNLAARKRANTDRLLSAGREAPKAPAAAPTRVERGLLDRMRAWFQSA